MTKQWPGEEPEERDVIFRCTCGHEGLIVESVNWEPWQEVFIGFWSIGHNKADCGCWRCRLRHIWRIIRHGHPYVDMVAMDADTAHDLGMMLIAHSIDILREREKGVLNAVTDDADTGNQL
jgi:hypothetical protein